MIGRPAVSVDAWAVLRGRLVARCGGRCEVCRVSHGVDPHHVRKSSAGGADALDNLVWLCRACHRRTDAAYADGRLVIVPVGEQEFLWEILRGPSKRDNIREAYGMVRPMFEEPRDAASA